MQFRASKKSKLVIVLIYFFDRKIFIDENFWEK